MDEISQEKDKPSLKIWYAGAAGLIASVIGASIYAGMQPRETPPRPIETFQPLKPAQPTVEASAADPLETKPVRVIPGITPVLR